MTSAFGGQRSIQLSYGCLQTPAARGDRRRGDTSERMRQGKQAWLPAKWPSFGGVPGYLCTGFHCARHPGMQGSDAQAPICKPAGALIYAANFPGAPMIRLKHMAFLAAAIAFSACSKPQTDDAKSPA